LHGGGDDQTGWIQFWRSAAYSDKAIADGTATPMIIVMPDASGNQTWFFQQCNQNTWLYEDFFSRNSFHL